VAKGYFIVTLLAGGATCAWALAHAFAFSSVRSPELIALLAIGITAGVASFLTYKVHFEGIKTKSREAEELSRLHMATVEALATAIDAKDQTSHCHVRRVQIYATGLGRLLGLSAAEIAAADPNRSRSEEHTSELQSRGHIVCRLLLEKKNN